MQHAADRFERIQPRELKRIPFTVDDYNPTPSLAEAIGWIILAFAFMVLCLGFLGLV